MRMVPILPLTLLALAACDTTGPKPRAKPALVFPVFRDGDEPYVAPLGATLSARPGVVVLDADDNPIPDVVVNFFIGSGNGSITGANPKTGADGLAWIGSWTLGRVAGSQRLEARVGADLKTDLYATAANPCPQEGAVILVPDVAVSAALETSDCTRGEIFADLYRMPLEAQSGLRIVIAPADHSLNWDGLRASLGSGRRVIVPAGTHVISILGTHAQQTGAYTVEVRSESESLDACEDVVVAMPGISTVQTLKPTDCDYYGEGIYSDVLALVLRGGETLTVTMSSVEFEPILELWDGDSYDPVMTGISSGPNSQRITWSAPSTGAYYIYARNSKAGVGGRYTLTIQ